MIDPLVKIDKPHRPFGEHVDVITPLSDIGGVHKMRIDGYGNILTEDVLIKGGQRTNLIDNT